MSFYSNFQTDKCPGPIAGNPLGGLNEKVCLQAQRVFDACIRQGRRSDVTLSLVDPVPASPTYPLNFVSAKSTTSAGIVSNLLVEPLTERERASRVRADITIPVSVAYTDANGVEGAATANVTLTEDVILNIPSPSIMPYTVEAVVSLVSTKGTYTDTNQFTIDACVTVILKVVMEVELLVPSYGYSAIPPCQEYTQEVCAGFFELPVFPQ